MRGGAYHLTSSVPVMVYQFTLSEYGPKGGPAGKDWTSCPGYALKTPECFSYSNDASLLAPSTALTSNVRVAGNHGGIVSIPRRWADMCVYYSNAGCYRGFRRAFQDSERSSGWADRQVGSFTNLRDDLAGGGRRAGPGGVGPRELILSGSLIHSTEGKPIQVISRNHLHWSADRQGGLRPRGGSHVSRGDSGQALRRASSDGSWGTSVGHIVRLVGNVDGTNLAYLPSKPKGCPDMLEASQLGTAEWSSRTLL